MVQLVKVPSLGVDADIVWLTAPAFSNSTFTEDPTLPEDDQEIVGAVPGLRMPLLLVQLL